MDKTLQLKNLYQAVKPEIDARDREFSVFFDRNPDHRVFAELAFCLLTPQSKALNCWDAVLSMDKNGVLFRGSSREISGCISCARFRNKKGEYIFLAREKFSEKGSIRIKKKLDAFPDSRRAREWLCENIKGMGLKEASHFLRNIGRGRGLAILDRHILKNLLAHGIINEIPPTLSKKAYLEIERRMLDFAAESRIPAGHLDLLLWYRETGKVFK